MFEKQQQKQEVTEGAVAIQAGNNVNLNVGLTFSEVKEICHLLFQENFPKLCEIAEQTAIQNVENYLSNLENKFIENLNRIDFNKIKDPDVQYSLNEIISASARKGDKIDSDVLSELIIERISISSNDIISIVCSEAMKIVPKLTGEHIAFLSLCHYLSSIQHNNFQHIEQFESLGKTILQLVQNGIDISDSNKTYLHYTGTLSILNK